MKITKKQLKRIIKEEAADCLKDYRAGGLTYEEYLDCVKRFEQEEEDYGYRYRPRKTSYVGASANEEKIAAIQSALADKPNKFLQSILSQLQRGRGLSGKQKAIVKRIMAKKDPSAVGLFEANKTLSKSTLRRIIKEELQTLKEQPQDPRGMQTGTGWDNFTPEGEAEDEMYLAAEDLPELAQHIQAAKDNAKEEDRPEMADMYENDAYQLQSIYDMSKEAFDAMEIKPPDRLSNYISRLDTTVRDTIPENLYNWIVGQR